MKLFYKESGEDVSRYIATMRCVIVVLKTLYVKKLLFNLSHSYKTEESKVIAHVNAQKTDKRDSCKTK